MQLIVQTATAPSSRFAVPGLSFAGAIPACLPAPCFEKIRMPKVAGARKLIEAANATLIYPPR
jgi:hypothetical protein